MKKRFSTLRVISVTFIIVAAIAGGAWYFGYLQPLGFYRPSNALIVIQPYRYAGTWVFDDARVGLSQEPFISGNPEMIDAMTADIPKADEGFRLLFSTEPFPDHEAELTWRRAERGGNWYYSEKYRKEGWLCPALFRYYREAPKQIYAKAEPI